MEKYLRKGTKIVLDGEIRNNNYTNREGQMVYGMEIVTNNVEFAESKSASAANSGYVPNNSTPAPQRTGRGWIYEHSRRYRRGVAI